MYECVLFLCAVSCFYRDALKIALTAIEYPFCIAKNDF